MRTEDNLRFVQKNSLQVVVSPAQLLLLPCFMLFLCILRELLRDRCVKACN